MTLSRRHFLNLSSAALAVAPFGACATESIGGRAFGSYWRLAAVLPADTTRLRARIEAIIASIDAAISPYKACSDLSVFNGSPSTDWTPIPDDLGTVLATALDTAKQTGGAFDPTVGPIVGRFGFGPIPAGAGGRLEALDLTQGALRKRDKALTLDLCGIAKGYALDLIANAVAATGVTDFVAELGGEVVARGRHPSGRDWRIALDSQSPPMAIALKNRAVATSGLMPQGYDSGAQHYSHIIDPRRGQPTTGEILTASVVAETAMQADALATAFCAMSADRAIQTAERLGIDALFALRDTPGPRTIPTGRFTDLRLI